ncbi:MAG: radical SAM protein [Candidatus Bathyarchaeota archaeon]|nr:radical SAM protein [Candidatus Bathyarchaeota archaeon]
MATLKDAVKKFVRGYRKTAVFALTTKCNCKCIMCDMHAKKPEYIPLNDAKKVLKFLADNGFLIAYFTGGEPTLHPNIVEIVDYAGKLGVVTTLTTNGSVSKSMLKRLKNAGLYVLSVSLDHWDPQICEMIRNHKNIMTKVLETIKYSRSIGLKAYALAFLNPFLVQDGVDKLVDYTNNALQVPLGFCYPTKSDVNSYGLGGQLSAEELSRGMDLSVKKLLTAKKNGGNIANLWVYMEDVLNFREGNQPNFYCKGGEEVIYVDWHGDVYPCFLREKMFNILRDKPRFLKDVKCNDCLINCFREPSILPQLPSSPRLLTLEALYSRSSRWLYG